MKKLIAVPAIAMVAAVGAASAAGFAGGVSAAPVQSGSTNDLVCAASASVVEWGTADHLNPPRVENALVKLSDSDCQGQAVHLIALRPDGTEYARFASKRLDPSLAAGTQYVRLNVESIGGVPAAGVPVENLNAIRITVDGGWSTMPVGGTNTN